MRRDIGGIQTALKTDISGVESAVKQDLEGLRREMDRASALKSLERAQRRIEEALPDLRTLASRRSAANLVTGTETALGTIRTQAASLRAREPDGQARGVQVAALNQGSQQILATAASITNNDPAAQRPATGRPATGAATIADAAEEIGLAAERLAAVAAAAARIPVISARERLRSFMTSNAIFFANGEDYRNPAQAQRVMGELARMAKEAGALVRVIGYTDERGTQGRNSPLAQSRADKVASALAAQGIARNRIVSVGRSTGPDISPTAGPDSANRRVEFELGFEGEAQ